MVCDKYWVQQQEQEKWTERLITEQTQGKVSKRRKEICNIKKNNNSIRACSRKELKKNHTVAWATWRLVPHHACTVWSSRQAICANKFAQIACTCRGRLMRSQTQMRAKPDRILFVTKKNFYFKPFSDGGGGYGLMVTHYCLTATFVPVLLKFQFLKKEMMEKNSHESVADIGAYLRLYFKIWRGKGFGEWRVKKIVLLKLRF